MMSVTISNLQYADEAHTTIDMDVDGWFEGQVFRFTYDPKDGEPLTLIVRDLLAAGGYTIAPYEPH